MQGTRGQYYDPTQHWAALLRYDASKRQSADVEGDRSLTTGKLEGHRQSRQSKVKQMSIGDDLPHMTEYGSVFYSPPSLPSGAQAPLYSQNTGRYDGVTSQEDVYAYEEELTLRRQNTPLALKGENAILVDRELERLRLRKPMAKRMKWRVLTGTMMLLVLAFTAYIFANYLMAYLALSPSNWFLSDSQAGTHVSPDPLLRSMALLELIISGIALFGILASGFYLRMTRRRSCGRGLIWFMAIISTTFNVGLSLANIALIVGWHKRYGSDAGQQLARTRDVGLRCQGSWDMDILWGAAGNSAIAKVDADGSSPSICLQDANKTLRAFLIAGGVRLAVFVVICTIWLICLGRYNATSATAHRPADCSIEESPEMHKLLTEEQEIPQFPSVSQMLVAEAHVESTEMKDVPDGFGGFVNEKHREEDVTIPGAYHTLSNVAPPKIERFGWQRTEPSSAVAARDDIQTYGNIGRRGHDREGSANAWSRSFMDRVYLALWGDDAEGRANGIDSARQDEGHGRDMTRLGVRGWFASRDMSRVSDEDDNLDDDDETMTNKRDEEADLTEQHMEDTIMHPSHSQKHERSPSQEDRSRQARHAVTQEYHEKGGDRYTVSRGPPTSVFQVAEERSKKRKQEQQDRLTFLANLQFDRRCEEAVPPVGPPLPVKEEVRTTSSIPKTSADTLLKMPTVQEITSNSSSFREELDDGIDDESDGDDNFWHAAPINQTPDGGGPKYVRQLGKLVHRLSAIESVGSGGERSQHQSRNSREPSALSTLY